MHDKVISKILNTGTLKKILRRNKKWFIQHLGSINQVPMLLDLIVHIIIR